MDRQHADHEQGVATVASARAAKLVLLNQLVRATSEQELDLIKTKMGMLEARGRRFWP